MSNRTWENARAPGPEDIVATGTTVHNANRGHRRDAYGSGLGDGARPDPVGGDVAGSGDGAVPEALGGGGGRGPRPSSSEAPSYKASWRVSGTGGADRAPSGPNRRSMARADSAYMQMESH